MPNDVYFPDSRLRVQKNVVLAPAAPGLSETVSWIQIFCANCGCDGGRIPETTNFVSYLCDPCAEKHGDLPPGMVMMPDDAFWMKVNNAMMEEFGRILTVEEQIEALKDDNHVLSKLAKDRPNFGAHNGLPGNTRTTKVT